MSFGAPLQFSGYGDGVNLTAQTRERRQGIITTGSDALVWRGAGPLVPGDSGGPVADAASGRALGLVKGIQVAYLPPSPTGGNLGPTVEATLALARAHGLALRLRLAGQGPPPVPAPPAPAATPDSPAPAPAGTPAPAAQPKRKPSTASRRAACRRKAKRITRAPKRRAALRRCARIR